MKQLKKCDLAGIRSLDHRAQIQFTTTDLTCISLCYALTLLKEYIKNT
jgi:hypothetical protein